MVVMVVVAVVALVFAVWYWYIVDSAAMLYMLDVRIMYEVVLVLEVVRVHRW